MNETSAQLKLTWAIKRVNALSREVQTFEHSDAYVPRVERNVRSPQEIEYRVFATERQNPSPDWPLMAGEAIQSLRAALDHVVYAISKRNRGKSQFPIFTDPCEFQVRGKPLIRGVPPAIRALIEKAQPYEHTPSHPSRDILAALNKLSNLDKHRTLATVACSHDFTSVGLDSDRVKLKWVKPFAVGDLSNNAEIAVFTLTSDSEIGEMNVTPSFTYEVRIEGRPLVVMLVTSAKRVFEVVTECETGKPMPLFAEYPIQLPLPGRHLDGSLIRASRR